MIIAIDGPAGAGKSSVSRAVARNLGFSCLDTGAMYRAIAWLALAQGISLDNAQAIGRLAVISQIEFVYEEGNPRPIGVKLDGVDVTKAIRTQAVDGAVSLVAAIPQVRKALIAKQRKLAQSGNFVVEGRDIGTAVFPDASLKIYLCASAAERARRRVAQNERTGIGSTNIDEVKKSIEARDKIDSGRATNPLKPARDAVQIDSTGRSIGQIVGRICSLMKERGLI